MKRSNFKTNGWGRQHARDRAAWKFIPPILGSVICLLVVFWLTASPAPAIVNGEFDDEGMFPNVGAIVAMQIPQELQDVGVEAPQAISSGTLIHPRVLLTAGHSVDFMLNLIDTTEVELDDFVVSFEPDVSGEGPDGAVDFPIPIEAVAIHPDFTIQQNDISFDVGAIILAEPAPADIPLVTLPELGLLDELVEDGELTVDGDSDGGDEGTPLPVVGYGATEESAQTEPPFTEFLILASGLRHFGASEFHSLTSHNLHLSQNFAQGESGGAAGDSGGPAFWMADDGSLVQVGLLSWGDGVSADLSVHARLDVPEVQDWLALTIDDVESAE